MSEADIFAALKVGVKFDTKRFKKDVERLSHAVEVNNRPLREGASCHCSIIVHIALVLLACMAVPPQ